METSTLSEKQRTSLRSWESCRSRVPSERALACEALREDQTVRRRVQGWLRSLHGLMPSSVVFRALSAGTFDDALDLWSDQLAKDDAVPMEHDLKLRRGFQGGGFFRSHHQLLCDDSSLLRRLELIRETCALTDRILLVGDDDQLSPLLAEAGFRQITVIDIDPILITQIRQQTKGAVRARVHDLHAPAPEDLRDDYDLLVMDPPYSEAGIELFLDGALAFCRSSRRPRVMLYCASLCLGRGELERVQGGWAQRGYQVDGFEAGASRYPYSGVLRFLFQMLFASAALALGRWRWINRVDLIPRRISSDLWILEASSPR